MRDIWFISDTHFGHENILKYCRPQFQSVQEMEDALIGNWNEVVKPQDLVYHLGDFAWKPSDAIRVRPMLHGAIRLVVGNHDDIPALVSAKLFQRVNMWRQFPEYGFVASHVPMRADQLRRAAMNVHGHVHGSVYGLEPCHVDVSVESIDFRPIHVDALVKKFPAPLAIG